MDDLPDFELTQVPLTADNIIEELEKAVTVNCNDNSRYSFVEDIDIDKLVKSTESRNTRKNTTWSVATFNDWRVARMKSNYCAIPELLQFTANDVNQWLSKFVIETRRKDGGLNQRYLSAKNLKHYLQNPVLFTIYEQYLNIVRDLNGTAFYRRLDKGSIKFGEQSVGVNKWSNIMKTMCAEAGIDGYFTNHSGKRTCATTLYQAGVPEQEIMNRTGHRSVESVRKY
ncbi:unnamed protein product [Mytilus coruscus]|uniref:Tyr recombinase domain-containing protein n=1 Tax=Mytilus coruscus TaxID=42192 RepID=A0A6J8CFK9_MYTCO|nr:unnamed protein product [Mytilus coruscus]